MLERESFFWEERGVSVVILEGKRSLPVPESWRVFFPGEATREKEKLAGEERKAVESRAVDFQVRPF